MPSRDARGAVLNLIRTKADLPRAGAAYETSRVDFKRDVGHGKPAELAKDVAAFAKKIPGTSRHKAGCRASR